MDTLVWPLTPDGMYSVRSAYWLYGEISRQALQSSSTGEGDKGLWNSIWKLLVPPKVRHFLWRVVRYALLTKINLLKWNVVADGLCELCRESNEDSLHALWLCDTVKAIWMSDQSFSFLHSKRFSSFTDALLLLRKEASPRLVEHFIMVVWCIWENRNRVRLGQQAWGIREVCRHASNLLNEFHDVHKMVPRLVVRSNDSRWKLPASGLYKINFDGALFEEQACTGLGVVIRDSAGLIIGALSQKIRYPGFVDMVEALAASWAVVFAKELCLQSMVVEGDSLRVIQSLIDARPSRTMFSHVIADIHSLASNVDCSFCHVKRGKNILAHALAHRAVASADCDVWLEELSRDLEDIFQFDLH